MPDNFDGSYKTWVMIFPGTGEDILASRVNVNPKNQAEDIEEIYEEAYKNFYFTEDNKNKLLEDRKYLENSARASPQNQAIKRELKIINFEIENFEKNKKKAMLELDKEVNALLKNDRTNTETTADYFLTASNHMQNAYFLTLQGVGAKNINPAYLNAETGENKKNRFAFSSMVHTITGKGEDQNIQFCLKQLEAAAKKNQLPEKIVLNGHSRGASATIELARRIYLKYGNQIKISMTITDPVPGPGRHTESKMVIPPNVDSLVIAYAGDETRKIFRPQDLSEILFNPQFTTVTSVVLPMNHVFYNKQMSVMWNVSTALKTLSKNLALAINNSNQLSFATVEKIVVKPTNKLRGNRAKKNFFVATDPDKNKALPDNLKSMHENLQLACYKDDLRMMRDNMDPISRMTEKLPDHSSQDREKILLEMYLSGREAHLTKPFKEKEFQAWEKNYYANKSSFMEKQQLTLSKLQQMLTTEKVQNQNQPADYRKKRVALLEHAIKSIELSKSQSPKEIFLSLQQVKGTVAREQKKLSAQRSKRALSTLLTFFHLPALRTKTSTDLYAVIDVLMHPENQAKQYSPSRKST